MRNISAVVSLALVLAISGLAQTPMGSITSSAPFQLRGASVIPGEGVPTWPVLAGDVIKSGTAHVIITLTDGSVIVMDPGATATLTMVGKVPSFQLTSGTAAYTLKSPTSLQLAAGNRVITPAATKGTFNSAGNAGFWTPVHTALVVGGTVGGATTAGLGVAAATNGGPQVSATQ